MLGKAQTTKTLRNARQMCLQSGIQLSEYAEFKYSGAGILHFQRLPGRPLPPVHAARRSRQRTDVGGELPVGLPLTICWHKKRRSRQAYSLSRSFSPG